MKLSPQQIRETMTNRFVEAMEGNLYPWRKPWGDYVPSLPMNFKSKRQYSGMNAMLLMWSGFQNNQWGTLKSWQQRIPSAKLISGCCPVEIFGMTQLPYRDKAGKIKVDGNGHAMYYSVAKRWEVCNAEQLVAEKDQEKLNRYQRVESRNHDPDFEPAERLISATGAVICQRGNSASYDPSSDCIVVPEKRKFDSVSDYYETVFHELCHWCEQSHRVGTPKKSSYAFRELVAEMGACFLLLQLKVPCAEKMLENSTNYVIQWLKEMNGNSKFIFDASAQASKVANYLLSHLVSQNNLAA